MAMSRCVFAGRDTNHFAKRRSAMQQWSRRSALAFIAGASVARYGKASAQPPVQSLGAIAAENGIVFGAAAGPVIEKDLAYRDLYQTQTRIVTTDVAMKM